jgi:hypothetical protein
MHNSSNTGNKRIFLVPIFWYLLLFYEKHSNIVLLEIVIFIQIINAKEFRFITYV